MVNDRATRAARRAAEQQEREDAQREQAWQQERRNCFTWNELDLNLLHVVAAHCDCQSLLNFSQVCSSWRNAADSCSDTLWKPLLERRYPRTFAILERLPQPEASFKSLYRTQHATQSKPSGIRPAPTCRVEEYIFTLELVKVTGEFGKRRAQDPPEIVESWTGTLELDDGEGMGNVFHAPLRWEAWIHTWENRYDSNAPNIELRAYVSRIVDGQLRTFHIFESEHAPDDEIEEEEGRVEHLFYGQQLACISGFAAEEDDCEPTPELMLSMSDDDTRSIALQFDIYDEGGSLTVAMSREQVLRYLDYGIPWTHPWKLPLGA